MRFLFILLFLLDIDSFRPQIQSLQLSFCQVQDAIWILFPNSVQVFGEGRTTRFTAMSDYAFQEVYSRFLKGQVPVKLNRTQFSSRN